MRSCAPGAPADVETATAEFHRWMPLIRFQHQTLLNLPIRKHIYMRRGAIASDKVRSPAPALDGQTIADLDDLLRRLKLGG